MPSKPFRDMPWRLPALAALIALPAAVCSAGEVTLLAQQDSYIQDINGSTNYGELEEWWAGRGQFWGLGVIRAMVEFDLSSLPTNPALIESATFSAFQYDTQPAAGGLPVQVLRMTAGWEESTVTWNNQPAFDGQVWASADVGNSFELDWIEWDVTELVRAQASGQLPNEGWLLKASSESPAGASRLGYFRSSEFEGAPNMQPTLVVNLVPEPATVALLGLGGLVVGRGGRRAQGRAFKDRGADVQ